MASDAESVGDGGADVEESLVEATFDAEAMELQEMTYGLRPLLKLRDAMVPIAKPSEVSHLKFLVVNTGAGGADEERPDEQRSKTERARGAPERAGAKSRGAANKQVGGRYLPEMGKTEIMPTYRKGQWWRNCSEDGKDVIVRQDFLINSPEVGRVQHKQYVRQQGPKEVFVSGPATGLQRMPVQPGGWVTVDARSVGGPRYLEAVQSARWQVVFSCGSAKRGDIVVRQGVSLDSEEVAVLFKGNIVEQVAPQEILEDGIVRMMIQFIEKGSGEDPSSSSRPPKNLTGWVTCDATSQGGPKFFAVAPTKAEASFAPRDRHDAPADMGRSRASGDPDAGDRDGDRGGGWSAAKNRIWKVTNKDTKELAVVNKPEPYAPGSGKIPSPDLLVTYLREGQEVEQVGHSRKVRGFMVMPIRILGDACTAPTFDHEGQQAHGWATRRMVDKQREDGGVWFIEISAGPGDTRDRRKQNRRVREHNL